MGNSCSVECQVCNRGANELEPDGHEDNPNKAWQAAVEPCPEYLESKAGLDMDPSPVEVSPSKDTKETTEEQSSTIDVLLLQKDELENLHLGKLDGQDEPLTTPHSTVDSFVDVVPIVPPVFSPILKDPIEYEPFTIQQSNDAEKGQGTCDRMLCYCSPALLFVLIVIFVYSAYKGSDAACLFIGVSIIFIVFGEMFYSRFLADYIFGLSNEEVTPANELGNEKDPDFCATPSYILWGHHWTSISGAVPIFGPAQAAFYGWLPGICWIVVGSLLSGAVHDFGTLVVSARNRGRSIADLGGYIISWRLRFICLLLINFLCVLVVSKFLEVIAKLFVLWPETVLPVWAEVPLACTLGCATRCVSKRWGRVKAKCFVSVFSVVALVGLYVLIFAAVWIEDTYGKWSNGKLTDPVFGWAIGDTNNGAELCRDSVNYNRDEGGSAIEPTCSFGAMQFWTVLLCAYAAVAACTPVWVLVQPRDFINSHQLKVVMAALVLCLVIKGPKLDADAIRSDLGAIEEKSPIFPMMFTLIACGATSGFHGLVSSGVTSKQLDKMRDARLIGYSGMMGESALAALVITIVCSAGTWKTVYATGVDWTGFLAAGATFLEELGVDARLARTVMNVLLVSFAATTLDSAMRIQRILVGEFGKSLGKVGCCYCNHLFSNKVFQISLSALPSLYIANSRSIGAVWNLFGATNQLTACVSLIVVAVYVLRFRSLNFRYMLPFLLPILFLQVMISWALIRVIFFYLKDCEEKECNWYSTLPTWPTVILSLCVAALVAAVYFEIGIYFGSGKFKKDEAIDPITGKMAQCSPYREDRIVVHSGDKDYVVSCNSPRPASPNSPRETSVDVLAGVRCR